MSIYERLGWLDFEIHEFDHKERFVDRDIVYH
jgi:hypothetical protein